MYYYGKPAETSIVVNESYEGETIEQKVDRIVNNGEPISDGAPIIYTERKDGVRPEYDIRTDRFEIAVDAMDTVTKTALAKREARIVEMENKRQKKSDGGAESIQGTKNE
jgi:hypothetical protein